MPKIYIAGRITGDPAYRAKFASAADRLEASGNIVLNPAMLPEGMEPEDYMRICFAMIDVADEVVFLSDWRHSPGSVVEERYCRYTGKRVSYETLQDTTLFADGVCPECGGDTHAAGPIGTPLTCSACGWTDSVDIAKEMDRAINEILGRVQ